MMARSIISRHYNANQPCHTLSILKGDEESDDEKAYTLLTEKIKTEKSVRFAKNDESLSVEDVSETDSLQTSKDIITWVPSEHLYSEDTFIPETVTGEKLSGDNQTLIPSYGSSTFIELDSDEETRTESFSSCTGTGSLASSDVFSSQNGTSLYRSWKDVTEIVKDIEDLEESEFVTRAHLSFDEDEATEGEDSFEEQIARNDFIDHSIHRLLAKREQSPRSSSEDSEPPVNAGYTRRQQSFTAVEKKEAAKFCRKAMKAISKKDNGLNRSPPRSPGKKNMSPLYLQALQRKNVVLENYGLSSTVLDKLKVENLRHALHKKAQDLDNEILRSQQFMKDHAHIEEDNTRKQFLSQTCAHVSGENMDDRIQAHLIKMHPVKCFAEFVSGLPKHEEGFRDVLYHYKKQVEDRRKTEIQE